MSLVELWSLLGFPAGCTLGALVTALVSRRLQRMEYRWACREPGCTFAVQATDPADCDRYATLHERCCSSDAEENQ